MSRAARKGRSCRETWSKRESSKLLIKPEFKENIQIQCRNLSGSIKSILPLIQLPPLLFQLCLCKLSLNWENGKIWWVILSDEDTGSIVQGKRWRVPKRCEYIQKGKGKCKKNHNEQYHLMRKGNIWQKKTWTWVIWTSSPPSSITFV